MLAAVCAVRGAVRLEGLNRTWPIVPKTDAPTCSALRRIDFGAFAGEFGQNPHEADQCVAIPPNLDRSDQTWQALAHIPKLA